MLNKVFDRVCSLIFIVSRRTASMSLKNSDSRPRFSSIGHSNTKSTLIVLASKNIAFLIRLDGLI